MNGTETREISNSEDVIDSRDVIARIEYLQGQAEVSELDDDEQSELAALYVLADEASQYAADWQYGETLIRDSYFEDYARQLADDIGAIDGEARWPACHIDWAAATESLQMDYSAVDFDGVTYWIR